MSFHSTHATSQALQPMHVVVSTSLHTVNSRCVPSPGIVPECADIFWMRSVAWLMAALLRFLDLHQKALELWCVGVGISDRRGEEIRQRTGVLAFVLLDSPVALVNRQADLIDLPSVNHHRLDAFGDEGLRDVGGPDARDFHLVPASDSQLLGHLRRN